MRFLFFPYDALGLKIETLHLSKLEIIMFADYSEDGPLLLGDSTKHLNASFRFTNTNVTMANTLRRAIISLTPGVAFRTEPYDKSDVSISVNTTPLVNEMIAHRVGFIPINVRNVANFVPEQYEFVLDVKNDSKRTLDVRAKDFMVFRKNVENPLLPPEQIPTEEFFPPDSITGDTVLITRLRPVNPPAPSEHLMLKAKPSISTGTENIRYSPVAQASYEYTRDTDPEHISLVFTRWLNNIKKITDPSTVPELQMAALRREFETMEIQRSYLKDTKGEPYDFTFHVESVGIQPVPMIVDNALAGCIALVSKYIDLDTVLPDSVRVQLADTRYAAIELVFTNEGHTLGNLLETYIVEHHIDGGATPVATYAGYKVPHPLRPEMFIRIAVAQSEESIDIETQKLTARAIVASACRALKEEFTKLRQQWSSLHTEPAAGAK